jgi:hypothetical protein
MYFVIGGLAIPAVIAIISVITGRQHAYLKVILVLLTVGGLAVGVTSSLHEQNEKQKAMRLAEDANTRLHDLQNLLALVEVTVGDLAKLNELSGGHTYYVRIAADTSRQRLEKFLRRIEKQFKGATDSGLVTIRDPKPGSNLYELVFGQHLDVAAAEVFHRLAMTHHFPPKGQVAWIEAEL